MAENNHRQSLRDKVDKGEVHTAPPLEIPVGVAQRPSISAQIQEQIAINVAKKKSGAS